MSNPELETKQEGADVTTRPETSGTIVDTEQGDSSVNHEKSQPKPAPAAFTIPDGGWRAWLVVFGCALVLFSTFGYVS